MPTIFDPPPAHIETELAALRDALDFAIPPKRDNENVLIATWNLRAFGSLTREWAAGQNQSPKRDLHALRAIIEILTRFDVIAIQEIVGDLRALRDMMNYLGHNWSFLMTDITLGEAGNNERMAFVFDRRRVQPSGLACELVVPPEWLDEIAENALRQQFARTPYAVSFRAADQTFTLVTLHVIYGDHRDERIPELTAIARWMAEWADRATRWDQNLLTLGDFNIDRRDDALWQAFISTGLTVPNDLELIPRTIFADPDSPTTDKYYDQIAWFQTFRGRRKLTMTYVRGGSFDFVPLLFTGYNLTRTALSWRISDHYPLWTEFLLTNT